MNRLTSAAIGAILGFLGILPAAWSRPLDEIMDSGAFNICVQEDDEPFSDRASSKGIFLDIGDLIAKDLDVKLTATWIISAEYIRKTSCDAVPAVADIPNDDPLRLTIPYLEVRTILVTPQSAAPVKAISELESGRIAVLANSYARHDLNRQGLNLSVAFLENRDILKSVAAGENAAGVVTLPTFEWYLHQHHAPLRARTGLLDEAYDYPASIGLRRADKALLDKVNAVLKRIMADGSLERIFATYGLAYEAPQSR